MSESTNATASSIKIIKPNWPLTNKVIAGTSCRYGGVSSSAGFQSLNLAAHVGDNVNSVTENRKRLMATFKHIREATWLNQVHGNDIINLDASLQQTTADASYTTQNNKLCVVMTADCLPILFSDAKGKVVAAAHAGWRGLATAIIKKTLTAMRTDIKNIYVWLGPAIAAEDYLVGAEHYQLFCNINQKYASAYTQSKLKGKYYADLYLLARLQLNELGVDSAKIYGAEWSTSTDQRFFSYRRQGGTCGRMATFIGIKAINT